MVVTEFGRVMDMTLQFAKAWSPMVVTESGMVQ